VYMSKAAPAHEKQFFSDILTNRFNRAILDA
jgi:hypothetical protein